MFKVIGGGLIALIGFIAMVASGLCLSPVVWGVAGIATLAYQLFTGAALLSALMSGFGALLATVAIGFVGMALSWLVTALGVAIAQ